MSRLDGDIIRPIEIDGVDQNDPPTTETEGPKREDMCECGHTREDHPNVCVRPDCPCIIFRRRAVILPEPDLKVIPDVGREKQERERCCAAANALDSIVKLCEAPDWDYPGQVVRDVAKALGMAYEEIPKYLAQDVRLVRERSDHGLEKDIISEEMGFILNGASYRREIWPNGVTGTVESATNRVLNRIAALRSSPPVNLEEKIRERMADQGNHERFDAGLMFVLGLLHEGSSLPVTTETLESPGPTKVSTWVMRQWIKRLDAGEGLDPEKVNLRSALTSLVLELEESRGSGVIPPTKEP